MRFTASKLNREARSIGTRESPRGALQINALSLPCSTFSLPTPKVVFLDSDIPIPCRRRETTTTFRSSTSSNGLEVTEGFANISDAIRDGHAAIYLAGAVHYRDAFGKERFTKFCYFRDAHAGDRLFADGPMAVYKEWNEAS